MACSAYITKSTPTRAYRSLLPLCTAAGYTLYCPTATCTCRLTARSLYAACPRRRVPPQSKPAFCHTHSPPLTVPAAAIHSPHNSSHHVSNACKFTPPGGQIVVTVACRLLDQSAPTVSTLAKAAAAQALAQGHSPASTASTVAFSTPADSSSRGSGGGISNSAVRSRIISATPQPQPSRRLVTTQPSISTSTTSVTQPAVGITGTPRLSQSAHNSPLHTPHAPATPHTTFTPPSRQYVELEFAVRHTPLVGHVSVSSAPRYCLRHTRQAIAPAPARPHWQHLEAYSDDQPRTLTRSAARVVAHRRLHALIRHLLLSLRPSLHLSPVSAATDHTAHRC